MLVDRPLSQQLNLKEFCEPEQLVVDSSTLLTEAIALMSQHCTSCLLIEAKSKLKGIFTERDLVRLIASETDLASKTIAEVMTTQPIVVSVEANLNHIEIIALFKQHKIRHLPLVDVLGKTIGVITYDSLRKVIGGGYLLKHKKVGEVMSEQVIYATGDRTLAEIAKIMASHSISCVVITRKTAEDRIFPIGIVTERDFVQYKTLNLDFNRLPVREVMSRPLLSIDTDATLQNANNLMLQHHIRRLVVIDNGGNLAGIITQSSLLGSLDVREMLTIVELLEDLVQQQTEQLEKDRQIEIERRKQLDNSQRYFREVLAEITDIVLIIEPEQQKISVISENARCFNLEKHDLIQQTINQFWQSKAERSFFGKAKEVLQTQQKINFEYSICLVDRRECWFSAQVCPFFDNQVIWIASNITQQKKQIREYSQANAQLEAQVAVRTRELRTANKLLQQQIAEVLSFNRPKLKYQRQSYLQYLFPINNKLANWFGRLQSLKLPVWTGAAVALTIALFIDLCRRGSIIIPVPFMLLIITVSMSANLGGVVAGLWSHLVWSLFVIYTATIGFGPQTLTGGVYQVTIGILVMGVFAVVQGWTKEQNRWLMATLRHLNANLEREIYQRTHHIAIANTNLKQEVREHIASKKALAASEEKFRAVFEQAGVGMAIVSLDKKLLQVNPKFCQFVGYSAEELRALTFEQITHPDDIKQDNQHVRQMRTEQLSTLIKEKRYIHKDGSVIWGNLTAATVKDLQQKPIYFVSVLEDITKRKEAELALQESEARFISLLNQCPFLIWTSGTNGLCNFFNTAWLNFTGKTLAQELGNGWTAGVHPQDLDFCLTTYQSAFARREKFKMEYRLQKGNGEYGWLLDEGVPRFKADGSFAGYIGTCVDISDRVRAKKEREQLLQQIEQERQFLESILRQMPIGIAIAQQHTGKILMSNDNATTILRHKIPSINQIEDYTKFGYLKADGTPSEAENYPLVRALKGETIQGMEIDYLCGDEAIRPLFINAAPIRNRKSEIIAAIATFYDLTAQKQAEAAKKEAENKSMLLKEIHHRIKNNLQVVSALLDLQSEQIQDPQAVTLLEKSQARIQTMALIHEKLYVSQNLGQIDFVEYVTSLTSYLYDSFIQDFRKIELTLDLEPTLLDIDLATPCGLIINELVVNSLQHGFASQSTGELHISFKKYAENYYDLIVQDNGSEISMEIETIEANSNFLGLSLVKSLVEKQLKGTLEITKDRGNVIKITFPLA